MEEEKNSGIPSYPGSVPMIRIDGAKIRQLRESNKLTQLYLATVVGVTTDTISRWENKRYQSIKLENAEKLAQALEIDLAEIRKQEQEEPELQTPAIQPPAAAPPTKNNLSPLIILTALFIISAFSTFLYLVIPRQPQDTVSAERILPPHVFPGQAFPVLIRVHSAEQGPVSLIIKEVIPRGTLALQGVPTITTIDPEENSLKWIRRIDSEESVYGYMCSVPANLAGEDRLRFSGSVTLKNNVGNRYDIQGANSLALAPYHWADSNRDYMIDDEEILAVYDTYSDIEELPIDRELIDSIWASSGYTWDPASKHFVTVD